MFRGFAILSLLIFCQCVIVSGQKVGEISEDFRASLRKFGEEPLNSDREAYRITVWPVFHSPLVIRVEQRWVVVKVLKGEGGYQEGTPEIGMEKTFPLSEKEFAGFREIVRKAELEKMSPKDTGDDSRSDGTASICLDGSSWVIERMIDGRYWQVERICPEERKLIEVGYQFLKISKLRVKKRELF